MPLLLERSVFAIISKYITIDAKNVAVLRLSTAENISPCIDIMNVDVVICQSDKQKAVEVVSATCEC